MSENNQQKDSCGTPIPTTPKELFGVHIRGVVNAALFVRADSEDKAEDVAHELLLKHIEDNNKGPCSTLTLTGAETTDLFETDEAGLEGQTAANDPNEIEEGGTIGQEAARKYAAGRSATSGRSSAMDPVLARIIDGVISNRVANQMAREMEKAAASREGNQE